MDFLAPFWVHSVTVTRLTDAGSNGSIFAAPATLNGFVRHKSVRAKVGAEYVTAEATSVSFPPGTEFVPPGSRVTLPAPFVPRDVTVLACSVADGGGLATPDHVTITVE